MRMSLEDIQMSSRPVLQQYCDCLPDYYRFAAEVRVFSFMRRHLRLWQGLCDEPDPGIRPVGVLTQVAAPGARAGDALVEAEDVPSKVIEPAPPAELPLDVGQI